MKIYVVIVMLFLLCGTVFAESTLSSSTLRSTTSSQKNIRRGGGTDLGSVAWSSVDVSFISQDPDPVEPGKYVTLRFKVENLGSDETGDLSFKLITDYPFSFDREEANVIHVGKMLPRQYGENAVILKYKVRVDERAVEGTTNVDIMQYIGNESRAITTENFPITVKTFDSILTISKITTTPEIVAPGAEGIITVFVKNLADSYLDDIRLELSYIQSTTLSTSVDRREVPLTPFTDSNEKVIEHLNGKETGSVSFSFVSDYDATPGVYKVPLTIKYHDASGRNYTKQSIVGVVVGDAPDLAVSIQDSEIKSAGNKGVVSIVLVNKGLTDVKLVYARLKENPDQYEILSPQDVYVGNIDSDDYETAEYTLYVKSGVKEKALLRMSLEFRDGNNRLQKKEIELPLTLYTSSEAKKYGFVEKNGTGFYFLILLLAVAGFFGWRWWKKRKKSH